MAYRGPAGIEEGEVHEFLPAILQVRCATRSQDIAPLAALLALRSCRLDSLARQKGSALTRRVLASACLSSAYSRSSSFPSLSISLFGSPSFHLL